MKKITILALIMFSFFFTDSEAQKTGKGFYIGSFHYSMSKNVGRADDYLGNVSFWGASAEIKKFVSQSVTVGFILGHNVISKKFDDGSTELTNGLITGPQGRYLQYTSMLANIGYVFNKGYMVRVFPYIQANFGTYYVWQRLQLGANFKDNNNWHIGVGPEAGIIFYIGKRFGINVNARYNYAISSGTTFLKSDNNSFQFINLNLGISYINK